MTRPYDLDAERVVLGTAIRDDGYRKQAQRSLSRDLFSDRHGIIWWTLEEMDARREPVDHMTLTARLVESGKFPGEDVGKLVGDLMLLAAVGYEGFEFNAHGAEKLLAEAARRRRYGMMANRLLRAAEENESAERVWSDLRPLMRSGTAHHAPQSLLEVGKAALAELERVAKARQQGKSGLRYGFDRTDEITGGQHPGDLIGLSAFTSQGKSAFALQVAHTVAKQGGVALLCSNEMLTLDHFYRLASRFVGVPHFQLRAHGANDGERARIITLMGPEMAVPLFFADGVIDIATFRTHLDWIADLAGRPVEWACLDWLQLMHEAKRFESRTREMEWTVSEMKQAAIEFKIPVLLVAQYNRASLGAENPVVRDTSQFEFASDVWMQLEADDRDVTPEQRREKRERYGGWPVRLVGRKNRHGIGEWDEPLWFNARCARFEAKQNNV